LMTPAYRTNNQQSKINNQQWLSKVRDQRRKSDL